MSLIRENGVGRSDSSCPQVAFRGLRCGKSMADLTHRYDPEATQLPRCLKEPQDMVGTTFPGRLLCLTVSERHHFTSPRSRGMNFLDSTYLNSQSYTLVSKLRLQGHFY